MLKGIIHIHYNNLYGHTLTSKPLSRGLEINHFGRAFLGHHYFILKFVSSMPGSKRRRFFKKAFHYMTYMTTS